jgi:heat shock protein HslJ
MNKLLIVGAVVVILGAGIYLWGMNAEVGEITPDENNIATPVSLDGTTWDFGEQGSFSFIDGRYSASVGCNFIGGEYVVNGSSITLASGAMTEMGCPPDLDLAEQALLKALPLINTLVVTESVVTLRGEGTELVLRKPTNLELVGQEWEINSLKEGEGIVSASVDEGTFLTFKEDGTFSGKSACNQIMGRYEMAGNALSFSDIGLTKMACPAEAMAREQMLVTTLENVTTYTIDRKNLTAQSADGEYQISLSAGVQ